MPTGSVLAMKLNQDPFRPHEVLWAVDVGVAGLEKVVRLPAGELELTQAQLQDAKSDIDAYLLECLKVEINGAAWRPRRRSSVSGGSFVWARRRSWC